MKCNVKNIYEAKAPLIRSKGRKYNPTTDHIRTDTNHDPKAPKKKE